MKRVLFIIAGLFYLFSSDGKAQETTLLGHWLYYKKIYQGNEMPEPPEANLRLHYEFFEDGTTRLYWWHEGENDRCEREGRFTVNDGEIVEVATKISPDNHPFCSQDPDMQEGKKSRTRFEFVNGDLYLHLPFSDEFLTYVWKKIDN